VCVFCIIKVCSFFYLKGTKLTFGGRDSSGASDRAYSAASDLSAALRERLGQKNTGVRIKGRTRERGG